MSPLPHFPKVSLNFMYSCLPQVHVSRNPSARSGCLPFPTYTRSASTACIHAFPRFMYPGIHPLAPDVSPSPLTQGQPQLHVFMPSPGSCIQESIRSLRMSPLPHLHKVSLNHNLPQVYESRNPSARSGCLPFPTYLRSAVPSPDQCLQESTCITCVDSLPHFPRVSGAFPGSVSPGVHLCHLRWTPFPTSPESAVPSPDQCLQESTYVTSDGLPSPLPQSQRCLPRISVSRSPLMSPQVDSLPHFPRVSGCHLQ
nr:uncharacterized protein LOC128698152 [Cherax quadricarinatus]